MDPRWDQPNTWPHSEPKRKVQVTLGRTSFWERDMIPLAYASLDGLLTRSSMRSITRHTSEPVESVQMLLSERLSHGRHYGVSAKTGRSPRVSDRTHAQHWVKPQETSEQHNMKKASRPCEGLSRRLKPHLDRRASNTPMFLDILEKHGMSFATGWQSPNVRRAFIAQGRV